ncbi:hypothetical protein D4764_0259720, partial [Takifugu flavidus]
MVHKTHHGTAKRGAMYPARRVTGAPPWSQAWGWGSIASTWCRSQPKPATWTHHPQEEHEGSGAVWIGRSDPRLWKLAFRKWNVTSLAGKELELVGVLEKRIRSIVEPLIEEEQCGFHRGTMDQLFTLAGVLEGSWGFAQPVHMCFVDLEKAYDRVNRSILWSRSLVWIAGCKSDSFQISSLLFANDVVLLAPSSKDLQHMLGQFATECEAVGMRISTSRSEAMVLARKKVECLLWVGEEVLPQVEEFKYLGILFTSEGRMEREIERYLRIGVGSAVMRVLNRSVMVKKELSRKAKLSSYRSIYGGGLSLRDRVRSSDIQEELGVEPLLLHIERSQLGWLGDLARMPSSRLPLEVLWTCATGRRPHGQPRTRWSDYISCLVWEWLEVCLLPNTWATVIVPLSSISNLKNTAAGGRPTVPGLVIIYDEKLRPSTAPSTNTHLDK